MSTSRPILFSAPMVRDGCEWDAVGKHASGHLLDGVEHLAFPAGATQSEVEGPPARHPGQGVRAATRGLTNATTTT